MSSIPPPDWNSPEPNSESVPADLGDPVGDLGELGEQANASAGLSPAQNLDEWVDRLKVQRAPDSSPSRWEVMGERGAVGEKNVAAVLERELKDSETVRIYSQKVAKPVGDIDALVIGPSGITIVDSKNWSGEVVVDRDQVLRQNGRIRHEKVDGMLRQRRAVKLALVHARPELRNIHVREIICLAEEESRGVEPLTGGVVLCGAVAAANIAAAEGRLSASDIQEVRTVLLKQLSKLSSEEIAGGRSAKPKRAARVSRSRQRTVPANAGARTNIRPSQPTVVPRGRPSSSRKAARRHRSRRSAGTSIGSLVMAGLLLVIALELLHFASRSQSPPTVAVTSQSGRSVVYVTAPAQDRVALRITAGRHTHLAYLHGIGTPRRWVVPRAWSRTKWITVSACIANPTGGCSTSSVTANNEFG